MYDAEKVAARVVDGLERLRTAVCAPAWLRLVQSVRAMLPPLVCAWLAGRLPRLEVEENLAPAGPLGADGDADRAARRHAR